MAQFMTSDQKVPYLERIGSFILKRCQFIATLNCLFLQMMQSLFSKPTLDNPAIRQVLFKQIYFTGLEAAKIIIMVALILGTVVVSQVLGLAGSGSGSLTGKILVWVIFLELGPLLTAIIVIARSGTAIAAELGSMKINGELAALCRMGIAPARYLFLPRVAGVSTAVVLLTIYFVLTSFIGGFLIVSLGQHIPYDQFIQGILASLGPREIIILITKATAFGLIIPLVCISAGVSVGTSATEVPQAATRAVINSLFAIFMLDGLITYTASILIVK